MREAWRELQASEGTDIDAVRRLLRILERTQESYDPLAGTEVWLCHYSHKHGTDIGVYQSADDAWSAALGIAYQYWNEEVGDSIEIPEDPEEVLSVYNDRTNEYIEIEESRIAPTPRPEPERPTKCSRCGGNHDVEVCNEEDDSEDDVSSDLGT